MADFEGAEDRAEEMRDWAATLERWATKPIGPSTWFATEAVQYQGLALQLHGWAERLEQLAEAEAVRGRG